MASIFSKPADPDKRLLQVITNALLRCLFVIGLALFVSICVPAYGAQIPEIASVPENLPNPIALNQRKAGLQRWHDNLKAKVVAHKSKCKGVEEQTSLDEWCKQEQVRLEDEKARYIAAVNKFNADVSAASRSIAQDLAVAESQSNRKATARGEDSARSRITQLQDKFQSLKEQIAIDQQILQNFGFEKTVDEIEYWGNLPARQVEDAKNEFKALLVDAALMSISKATGAVGSLTPEEVDALNRLADAQGAPSLGIVAGAEDLHKAIEALDKARTAYETADAVHRKQMFDAVIKLGGLASKNPAFGLLLTADKWAAYQVYQSATAVKTVRDLTKVNEGDLVLLKARSEKVKNEVDQLTRVKKQLAQLSPQNDSTQLVRKPR